MIPAEYSIRGPHGTLPWVAIVDVVAPDVEDELHPVLVWACNREQAEAYVRSQHRNIYSVRMFRADRQHHLGNARVVPLTELG